MKKEIWTVTRWWNGSPWLGEETYLVIADNARDANQKVADSYPTRFKGVLYNADRIELNSNGVARISTTYPPESE